MKLPCKVIEDLLPTYYDGVCSDESAELIEEHLKGCIACSGVLVNMESEIELPTSMMDEMKPLQAIQKRWKATQRSNVVKGICIGLGALLLIFSVLVGVWYFSYGKYWYGLISVMDHVPREEKYMSSSDYHIEKDGYRFDVCMPFVLSNSGFVRIMDGDGLVVFLYPEVGGRYSFWVFITDSNNESFSIYLKKDMSPDFDNHPFPVRNESQKQYITRLLEKNRGAITAMLASIRKLWGIDLLEYMP